MKTLFLTIVTLIATGCLTRAPTNYEMDRRAGLTPPIRDPKLGDNELSQLTLSKNAQGGPRLPQEYEKRLEKTWLFERSVGGGTLQGSWFWMEVSANNCNCDAVYDVKEKTLARPSINPKR